MPAAFWAGRQRNGAEVVDVEVAAALAGKHQRRAVGVPDQVERVKRSGLERHRSHARFRLRDFEFASGEGAAHVDDALVSVDVAFLECDPLRRPQPGRGREQDHRPVSRADRFCERFEIRPRLERTLLFPPPHRVVDTDLGRVDVEHPPRHCSVEDLPQRLGCLEAVTGRERHPPLGDLLRGQLTDPAVTEHGGRLAEQIAELLDRHRLHVVLRQVGLDELGERQPARDSSLASKPFEFALERVTRVLLRGEPATLDALGVAAAGPVAIRPQPLAVLIRAGSVRLSVLVAPSLGIHSFQESTPSLLRSSLRGVDPRSHRGPAPYRIAPVLIYMRVC